MSPARVIVTAGSSAALLLVLALLVNRDEEFLVTDPGYPCNRHFVRVLEGAPVGIPVGPDTQYQLTAAMIDAHWGPRTRGVLLASPSNPTGTMVPPAEMRRIADIVARRGGRLIVDEIYLGLSYEERGQGRAPSALQVAAEWADDMFVVSSFSKYFNMTGWRLGLGHRARAARARHREARAEPLHLAGHGVAASGTGVLRARRRSSCWSSGGRRFASGAICWCPPCGSSASAFP